MNITSKTINRASEQIGGILRMYRLRWYEHIPFGEFERGQYREQERLFNA